MFFQSKVKRGSKLDPLSQRGRYLGSAHSKIAHFVPEAHRVWDPALDSVVIVAQAKQFCKPTRVSILPLWNDRLRRAWTVVRTRV